MKRIIFVANLKGGVGKTVFSKILLETLRASGSVSVAAYDSDGGVGGLLAAYGTKDAEGYPSDDQDATIGVGGFDIRSDVERGMILNCMETAADVILIDTAGGSLVDICKVTDAGEGTANLIDCLSQNGYRLTIAHVISNLLPSVKSVGAYVGAFGADADHVVVRNLSFGRDKTDFPYWYGYVDAMGARIGGSHRESVLRLGGVEIDLPDMPRTTFAKVEAMNIPYCQAQEERSLQITERMHIQRFRKEFALQCSSASKFLMPT